MDIDRELVKRVLEGDIDSFTQLVNKYYPKVLTFIRKADISSGYTSEAEDLAQEVFIKVYNNLYKYDDHWSFSTWLYRISINTAKDAFRRRHQTLVALDENQMLEKHDTFEDKIELICRQEMIADMLKKLNADVRCMLVLRYYEDMSFEEIGRIYGISSAAAKMKISRARDKLGKIFGSKMQGGTEYEM